MKIKNYFWYSILIITFLISFVISTKPFVVQANQVEEPFTYETLSVYIMPQYDIPDEWHSNDPAVFVGIYGTLVNDSDRPYDGKIHIPTSNVDSQFHFSIAGGFNDDYSINKMEATVNKDNDSIYWELDEEIKPGEHYDFVVEYYFAAEQRKTAYDFSFPYEVEREIEKMDFLLFEPYNAENFTVKGNIGEGDSTNSFGITAHKFDLKKVHKNTAFDVTVSYNKEDETTTLEAVDTLVEQAETVSKISKKADAEVIADDSQPLFDVETLLMMSIGALIIILFIIFVVRNRRKTALDKEEK